MKNKKALVVAIAGITTALTKGYDLLNDQGQMPAIEKEDLSIAGFAYQIVRELKRQVSLLEENERFEGMTPEEIHDKKELEKAEALAVLQAESAAALKEMKGRPAPDPEPEQEPDSDPATDQDPNDQDPDGSEPDPSGEGE